MHACAECQAACGSLAQDVARPAGLAHQIHVQRRHLDCWLASTPQKRARLRGSVLLLCQHTERSIDQSSPC
jgi:hypothetical protein